MFPLKTTKAKAAVPAKGKKSFVPFGKKKAAAPPLAKKMGAQLMSADTPENDYGT